MVNRYVDNGWRKQFYAAAPLFTIKIGPTSFQSKDKDLVRQDISFVTTGIQQHVTKRFSGTYEGSSFSVTLTLKYNTTNPEYLVKEAVLDMSHIPSNTPIIFAYGWDTFVNTSDNGYAYIVPDFLGFNNRPTEINYYMTTAQVQNLRLVGASNATGDGTLIGFFSVERNFDRAVSSFPYNIGYSYNLVNMIPGSGSTSGDNDNYKFQFGPFTGGRDNSTGVGYDNIPPGQVTDIQTGIIFVKALEGELDYAWNGQKNLTANIGDHIDLNLTYNSYNSFEMSGIAFRVDFPGQLVREAGSSSGFTSATHSWTVGDNYYQLTDGSILALGNATITIPITTVVAGKWVMDVNSITHTIHTTPLGAPSTLTVVTSVELSDELPPSNICSGSSKTFTVKYPNGVVAAQDVTIGLTYSGATGDFSVLPASVVIPAGANSADFAVTTTASPMGGSSMTITLSSTDRDFVSIGSSASMDVQVFPLPALVAGGIGTVQTICPGDTPAPLTETDAPYGGTGTYTYQWQSSSTGSSPWTNIPGATLADYSPGALTESICFRRLVTSGTCGTLSGNSVWITVVQPAAPTLVSAPTVCTGNNGVATVTPPSGCTTDWYETATGVSPIVAGSNTLTTPTTLMATDVTRTVTYYAESRHIEAGCRSATRTAVNIQVSPCVVPVNPHLRSRVY
ncbi:MAG: hypothetical protein LBB84_03765 [Tannerellaceae bacterium]|nr:hypothetical protein [Tannerellaceae bacterium]